MVLQMTDGREVKAMVEIVGQDVIFQTIMGPQVFTVKSVEQVAARLTELIQIKKGMVG